MKKIAETCSALTDSASMASDRTKEEILHEKILSTKITYQDGMSKITATIDKGSRKKASNESKNKL